MLCIIPINVQVDFFFVLGHNTQARIAQLVQFLSVSRYSSFLHGVQTGLGPTKLPIQCVPEALPSGIKCLGHVDDNSLHLVLGSRTVELSLRSPYILIKHRGNFAPFFILPLCSHSTHFTCQFIMIIVTACPNTILDNTCDVPQTERR